MSAAPSTATGCMPKDEPIKYVLMNVVTGTTYPLFEGRNAIGRSPNVVDDVHFINLESPRAAISRMHAAIIVAPNGDVWICDANSTNGTHLAVRDGVGILLEPERFYQCIPGTRILFGDVELTLVVDDTGMDSSSTEIRPSGGAAHTTSTATAATAGLSNPPLQPPPPRAVSDVQPTGGFVRARSSSLGSRAAQSQHRNPVSAAPPQQHQPQHQPTSAKPIVGSTDRLAAQILNATSSGMVVPVSEEQCAMRLSASDVLAAAAGCHSKTNCVPFLQGEHFPSPHKDRESARKPRGNSTDAPLKHGEKELSSGKKSARRVASEESEGDRPKKRGRGESKMEPLKLCLSGFDSKDKEVLGKIMKARSGAVVQVDALGKNTPPNQATADVLVVKDPPNRTPKFLIAVGTGTPIVTSKFVDDGAELSDAPRYLPDLVHGAVRYNAKKLQLVLDRAREQRRCALQGKLFFISDSVGSSRDTLVDVIKGCGGAVSKKKGDKVEIVTDADEVYHKILTGGFYD